MVPIRYNVMGFPIGISASSFVSIFKSNKQIYTNWQRRIEKGKSQIEKYPKAFNI